MIQITFVVIDMTFRSEWELETEIEHRYYIIYIIFNLYIIWTYIIHEIEGTVEESELLKIVNITGDSLK